MVKDPSYVSVAFHNPNTPYHNMESRTIYIKDTTATYAQMNARTRTLLTETADITFGAEWLLNGVKVADSGPKETNGQGTVETPYGDWILVNTGGFNTQDIHATRNSRFEPDNNAINSIAVGDQVSVILDLEVPHDITKTTTIDFLHYTSPLWDTNSTNLLTEDKDTGNFSVVKEATITTHHSKVSEFSFISKLYDDSSTPTEFTLVPSEQVAGWPGMELTAETGYGQWFVGNLRACETDKRCYDVRFVPYTPAISGISGKSVRNDLEVVLTENGTVTETKTLTYNIVDENTSLSLDGTASNVIRTSDTITNLSGTATTFKDTTHTFAIEVNETTDNQGTTKSNVTNDDTVGSVAGFDSKVYGNNLDLGTWYFEETDHTTSAYLNGTEFHTVTRRFQFRPNSTFIGNLNAGEVRYSTLTVKTLSGSDTISSQTFTIAIYRSDLPNFKISIANSTINEGENAEFTITADKAPPNSVTISYTPTNTVGNFLSGTADSPRQATLTNFTKTSGVDEWTDTFTVAMRANNNTDETHGIVTVALNPSTTIYTTATAPDNSATVSITDLSTPSISIAAAPNIVEGQFARFTVSSDIQPWRPLAIRFTPTETTTTFLDTTNGDTGTTRVANPAINFAPEGNSFTGTLLVPTKTDSANAMGTINVQLENDSNSSQPDYQRHSTENSNMVRIVPTPVPELSIITEDFAIDEAGTATIKVQASVNPLRDFPISYTPTNETGEYLKPDFEGNGHNVSRTTTLEFKENSIPDPDNPSQTITMWTTEIMIETVDDDGIDAPHGEIKVTLNTVTDVNTVASGADHVDITINDSTKPLIKIGIPPTDIQRVYGNNGAFTIRPITITSDIEPHGNNLTIKFRRAEPNSDFIDPEPVDDEEQTQIINFTTSNAVTSGTMLLSLKDDPDEGSGNDYNNSIG